MSREREIDDAELMDVARDPEQAHRLHKALRTMSSNPNVDGRLQRMAKEVLSGRIGMRDVIQTETYMDALGDRMQEIRRAAENETLAEKEAKRDQVERWERSRLEEEEKDRAERDGPTRPGADPGLHRPRHRP